MLKIVCPTCQSAMTLSQFKPGKFTPTCKGCQTKFQLLIAQKPDGTFACKSEILKPPTNLPATPNPVKKPAVRSPAPSHFDETRETDLSPATNSDHLDATQASQPTPIRKNAPTIAATGNTQAESGVARTSIGANDPQLGGNLGPYRLLKLLGQGGMGSVFLAKQTSLDRNVALKVIRTKLADRPAMMARFTREAYAAAQLVHPNVVQVYDMGDDRGNCFFSMELVEGSSLADYVADGKKVDPEQAASFILHAARGLAFAHNAGMVHRDIKPANLLVDASGIVKVADLGLVKVADQADIEDRDEIDEMSALSASKELTRFGTAVGTPYYMAPEQARNSVTVDHRADIYSLGCTFYVLLTGQKPFDGNSFQEVVSKHSSAPLVVPSRLVARVPESLSAIVAKMMAKDPADRYQSMQALIPDLEKFLGISSTVAFTPEEQDAELLERQAAQFNNISLARLRGVLPLALIVGSCLIAALTLFFSWRWASGFFVLPVFACAGYFLIAGLRENSNLFAKSRELVFRSGFISWFKWLAAVALLLVASMLVGLFLPWFVCGLVGIGLGAAYYFLIDKPIHQARIVPVREIEKLLRKLRLKGMEESSVQLFVAKYGGKNWEEMFETLFGYPAKRRMRDELIKSEMGKSRPKFWPWRDRINDGLESRIAPLVEAREKQHLQKVELAGLQADGVAPAEAKERAAQMAEAIVDHGDSIRVAALQKRIAELDPEAQRMKQRLKVQQMLAEARSGQYRKPQSIWQKIKPVMNLALGSYTRFLLGCLLIVGCLLWARQENFLEVVQKTAADAQQAIQSGGIEGAQAVTSQQFSSLTEALNRDSSPLAIPLIGELFFFNFNALIAGLILLSSSIVFGWRMSIFAIPAAAIALWGAEFGIPNIQPIRSVQALSAVIAVAIVVAGFLFGRSDS